MSKSHRVTIGAILSASMLAILVVVACGALNMPAAETDEVTTVEDTSACPSPALRTIGAVTADGQLLWTSGTLKVTKVVRYITGAYAIYVTGLTEQTMIQAMPRGASAMPLAVVDDGYALAQGYIAVVFVSGNTLVDRPFFFVIEQ